MPVQEDAFEVYACVHADNVQMTIACIFPTMHARIHHFSRVSALVLGAIDTTTRQIFLESAPESLARWHTRIQQLPQCVYYIKSLHRLL